MEMLRTLRRTRHGVRRGFCAMMGRLGPEPEWARLERSGCDLPAMRRALGNWAASTAGRVAATSMTYFARTGKAWWPTVSRQEARTGGPSRNLHDSTRRARRLTRWSWPACLRHA